MRYLLALILPPLASRWSGGARFPESLGFCVAAVFLPPLMVLTDHLFMAFFHVLTSPLLWLISAVLAIMDVKVYYREQHINMIAEAVRRGQAKSPKILPSTKPMPASYDSARQVWKID
jgi:hypothetical protein